MAEMTQQQLDKKIHDVRKPLNRISMQAELIKLVLETNFDKAQALTAVEKILQACQDCSEQLQQLQAEKSSSFIDKD
jgi:signal transduction histidine kinase